MGAIEQSDRLAFSFYIEPQSTRNTITNWQTFSHGVGMIRDGEATSKDEKNDTADEQNARLAGTKRTLQQTHTMSELSGDEGGEDEMDDDLDLDPEKRKEVRKRRRVMANRRSARESRERQKKLLTDLQESVESLASENANLAKENITLRQELATLMEKSGGAASLGMHPNIQV